MTFESPWSSTCGYQPAMAHGAYESGLAQAQNVLDFIKKTIKGGTANVVIIGAGISGLACASKLIEMTKESDLGFKLKIEVLEARLD